MQDEEKAFHPILDVPPQLIAEAAVGVDTLEKICARYHYTPEQTELLRNDPGFQVRVLRMEAELKKDGVTFRMRAAHLAESLLPDIYRVALDPSTSLTNKLSVFGTLVKLGELEPKPAAVAAQGSGFSITINIPQVGEQKGRTIEMNSDVSTVCDAEPLLVAGFGGNDTPGVNSNLNSSLELPEDWRDE